MMGLGFGFGGIGMILFWGLVIIGGIYLIRQMTTRDKPGRESTTPMEILKKRYASGEISHAEFDRLKQELRHS